MTKQSRAEKTTPLSPFSLPAVSLRLLGTPVPEAQALLSQPCTCLPCVMALPHHRRDTVMPKWLCCAITPQHPMVSAPSLLPGAGATHQGSQGLEHPLRICQCPSGINPGLAPSLCPSPHRSSCMGACDLASTGQRDMIILYDEIK